MFSTWLFIIIFNATGAQAIEMQSQQECLEMKAFTDKEIAKHDNLKGKVLSGCFKNLGEKTKET